jgi:hypothetical protein
MQNKLTGAEGFPRDPILRSHARKIIRCSWRKKLSTYLQTIILVAYSSLKVVYPIGRSLIDSFVIIDHLFDSTTLNSLKLQLLQNLILLILLWILDQNFVAWYSHFHS